MSLGWLLRRQSLGRIERDIRAEFDAEFYLAAYPDVEKAGTDPLRHFVRHGWKEHRDPAPDFSTRFYLENNPEVANAGINPFWHYLTAGRAEGRAPRPAPAPEDARQADPIHATVGAALDRVFYLSTYPEVAAAGVDPVEHYLNFGVREGRDPAPWFSTRFYLEDNPDVANAGVNPFWHYLTAGKAEGRAPSPAPEDAGQADPIHATVGAALDRDFYLSTYPEVAEVGIDPVEHYLNFGTMEGRDPAPWFSTRFYLENNPDVGNAGVNPFWHYLTAGKAEGRRTRHPGGYKAMLLNDLKSPDRIAENYRRDSAPDAVADADAVRTLLSDAEPGGPAHLVLAFSHDNYKKVSGGIQLCIHREELECAEAGFTYLNVHPWQPLPYLARPDDPDPLVSLVLKGAQIGQCRMSALSWAVADLADSGATLHLVIHSLLGHSPEAIIELAHAAGTRDCLFWLHDFFSICPSFTLQRNQISYCGAPDQASAACGICTYGAERIAQAPRMAAFFDSLDMTVVAPSKHTRNLWRARSDLAVSDIVIAPHVKLSWSAARAGDVLSGGGNPDRPVRVAYVGFPAPHKGWDTYVDLARHFGRPGGFEFYYFGVGEGIPGTIRRIPVQVNSDNYSAMTEALAAHDIDLMIHWSSWPETFSFSTYEALAANAFVITNPVSGNVADTVRRLDRGEILDSVEDLTEFLASGQALKLARKRRALAAQKTCRPTMSRMSVRFLLKGNK